MRALNRSGNCSWGSNNLLINIEPMNIYPVYTSDFILLSRNVMRYIILVSMDALSLLLFDNDRMYWKRSLVGETVYPYMIISC